MNVKLFSDGSARGNPNGPGGYGYILRYINSNGTVYEYENSAGYKKTTNNRMELMGVISGLESLKCNCNVEVVTDSKYVTDAFNKRWISNWLKNGWKSSTGQPVKNIDLWKRLLDAVSHHKVKFTWVKGHAGFTENERCDSLATSAADGQHLLDDTELI